MTWLLSEHSRLTRFHAGDRDTLADTHRAYVAGLAAWMRDRAEAAGEGAGPERAVSALSVDDETIEVVRASFAAEARRAYRGPLPYAHALTERANAQPARPLDPSSTRAPAVRETHRGLGVDRALMDGVRALRARLSPTDAEVFALRFVDDQLRRDASLALGVSPHAMKEREGALRRALLDVVVETTDAGRAPPAACAAISADMARLLVDGSARRARETLAHARGCARCRAIYDGFATIEPTDARRDLTHGFRADVDMDAPPRLLARTAEVLPSDASEEVPMYARASGHLVSLIVLTLAAMGAVAFVTRDDDGATSAHVVERPSVALVVACVTRGADGEKVAIVRPDTDDACPRAGTVQLTAEASVAGRALALVDGAPVFGPSALPAGALKALSGARPLAEHEGQALRVRLVFVAGEIDDDVLRARAEHPLPHDVVVERTIAVGP